MSSREDSDYSGGLLTASSGGLQRSTMCIPRLELPDPAVSGGNIQPAGRYQFGNRSSSWCALPVSDLQFGGGGNTAFGGGIDRGNGHSGNHQTFQRRASDRDVPANAAWAENELSVSQYHGGGQPPERRNSADNRTDYNYRSWDRRAGRNHQYSTQRSAESLLPTDGSSFGGPNNDAAGGNFGAENVSVAAAAVTANTKIDFCKIVAATMRKETGVRRMLGGGVCIPHPPLMSPHHSPSCHDHLMFLLL